MFNGNKLRTSYDSFSRVAKMVCFLDACSYDELMEFERELLAFSEARMKKGGRSIGREESNNIDMALYEFCKVIDATMSYKLPVDAKDVLLADGSLADRVYVLPNEFEDKRVLLDSGEVTWNGKAYEVHYCEEI